MIMTIVNGSRKNRCPNRSIQLRIGFGSILLMMSMRMCSLRSNVQGEHKRKTTENRIHCSSSHVFELWSNNFRMMALPVETRIAAKSAQESHLPNRELIASMTRLNASNACKPDPLRNAPRRASPWSGALYLRPVSTSQTESELFVNRNFGWLDEMAKNTREGGLVGRLKITSPHNKRGELPPVRPSITEPRAF